VLQGVSDAERLGRPAQPDVFAPHEQLDAAYAKQYLHREFRCGQRLAAARKLRGGGFDVAQVIS